MCIRDSFIPYDEEAQSTAANYQQTTFDGGTLPWTAPEVLCRDVAETLRLKVDSYSFGIVLWELVSPGQCPFSDYAHNKFDMMEAIINGERPTFPQWVPEAFRNLSQKCWAADANGRPSFTEIVPSLEALIQNCQN